MGSRSPTLGHDFQSQHSKCYAPNNSAAMLPVHHLQVKHALGHSRDRNKAGALTYALADALGRAVDPFTGL